MSSKYINSITAVARSNPALSARKPTPMRPSGAFSCLPTPPTELRQLSPWVGRRRSERSDPCLEIDLDLRSGHHGA